jgi:hypothetical protein
MLSYIKVASRVMRLKSSVCVCGLLPNFEKKSHGFYETRYESYLNAVRLNVIKSVITTRMLEFVDGSDVRNT